MNTPPDLSSLIEKLFFSQNQQAGRFDDAVSTLHRFGHSFATWLGIGLAFALLLTLIVIVVYRPRLSRGAFWVRAFGLFGGTPTLYLHSRPSSFCGVFTHSRRLKHRSHGRGKSS